MKKRVLFVLMVLIGLGAMAQADESDFPNWKDISVVSVKPITVGHTKPFSPWSPDGEWITYSNYFPKEDNIEVTEPVGVYVIKCDGTEKRLVAKDGFRPSFGRHQRQIVYGKLGRTNKLGYKGTPEEDIWIVNFDGSENRPIAADEEDNRMKNYAGTSITYDGKSVVYNITEEIGGGVGIVNIDGSNKRPLVMGSGIWGYSKDGTKVFVESVNNVKKGYVVGGWMNIEDAGVNTGGEGTEKVEWVSSIKYPENHYGHPHVSFDGTMITYDSPSADYPLEKRNIWIGLLDGSNKNYRLTNYGKTGAFGNHPRWSPDGKWIVYDEQLFTKKGVKNKVTIINVETKKKKGIYGTIVPKHSGWAEPGWSPDGRKIFFYAPDPNNGNKPSIWIAVLREAKE